MLKYIFEYADSTVSYHEVIDKLDFVGLLGEVDEFYKMYFFDNQKLKWREELVH